MLVKNYKFYFSNGTVSSFVESEETVSEEITIEYHDFFVGNGYSGLMNVKLPSSNNIIAK